MTGPGGEPAHGGAGRRRFHIPADRWGGALLRLEGVERHHCVEVLRLRPGRRVTLFDGAGGEAEAEIVSFDRHAVMLRLTGPLETTPPPRFRITLAQAILKGSRMDFIVQKATELGVAAIAPVVSERTVVRLDPETAEERRARWTQQAIESAKQCGQNRVPQVEATQGLTDFLRDVSAGVDLALVAALRPEARGLRALLAERAGPVNEALLLVGPEGDFTPKELELAGAAGFQPLDLGPAILRSETAALYALSVLSYELRGGV